MLRFSLQSLRQPVLLLGIMALRLAAFSFACVTGVASAAEVHTSKSLLDALAGSGLDVSEQVLKSALQKAAVAEGMAASDLFCLRDYSACPAGWSLVPGSGGLCKAPGYYDGSCPQVLDLRALAPQEKAHVCSDVAFPCVGECTQDFAQSCPADWSLDGSGSCVAPASYAGKCVTKKSFAALGIADRSAWASFCEVQWPCRQSRSQVARESFAQTCAASFQEPCPAGWENAGGLCKAPVGSSSPCGAHVDLTRFSLQQKEVWATACNVAWPCA